jgi:hypothetical protein
MKDIDEKIERWIDEHTYAKGNDSDRYLPAVREWGRKVAKTFYDEGRKDEMESLDCFTRMHQEMCHRYVEASKRDDPDAGQILEEIKAFEKMMGTYMNAEILNYKFVDKKYYDFVK